MKKTGSETNKDVISLNKKFDIPVVALCGDGGSGKDYVAKILSAMFGLPYKNSTSWYAIWRIYTEIAKGKWDKYSNNYDPLPGMESYNISGSSFVSFTDLYQKRSSFRKFLREWISTHNEKESPAEHPYCALYIEAINKGEHILTGIRQEREFTSAVNTGLIDLSIWIHSPSARRDCTQEYGMDLCDIILFNDPHEHNLEETTNFRLKDRLLRLYGFVSDPLAAPNKIYNTLQIVKNYLPQNSKHKNDKDNDSNKDNDKNR